MVQSRPLPRSEDWLTGLFDFRGNLLPLIDSSRLLGDDASDVRMSSRILVICTSEEENPDRVGLIVEQVLGSEDLDFDNETLTRPPSSSDLDFLGPVALTPDSTIQLTFPTRLPTRQN